MREAMAYSIKYFICLELLSSSIAFATSPQPFVWDGTSSSMATTTNWTPNGTPNSDGQNDPLTFPSSMSLTMSIDNDIPGTLLTGNLTINDAYIFTGNSFGVNDKTGFSVNFGSTGANINLTDGLILNGTWTVTSTASPGNTIGAQIIGSTTGNLYLKNGLLILDAANAYSGVYTIGTTGGMTPYPILQAGTNNTFGGTGFQTNVTLNGTSTLDLHGFSSAIGTLAGAASSTVTLGAGTLTVNDGSAQTPFYGVISGAGGNLVVTKSGLALMGANTYSGTTTISSGGHLDLLSIGSTTGFTFSSGGGYLVFGNTLNITTVPLTLSDTGTISVVNGSTVTISSAITGSNNFIKQGPGTLVLDGINNLNSYMGNFHIWGGILNIANTLGESTGFTFDSSTPTIGTLQIGAGISSTSTSQPFAFTNPGIIDTNGHNFAINGAISGANFLVKTGAGTLTLGAIGNNLKAKVKINNGALSVIPTTYNDFTQTVFTGTTTTGTLQIGADYNPFAASVVFMGNGSINTNSHYMNITGIVAGLSGTMSGTTFTFNKIGEGTLTLSALNLYAGPTHVAAGTLQAGIASTTAGGAFGVSSTITIDSGATLDFQTYANSVGDTTNNGTITSSATISATSFTQGSSGTLSLDFPTSAATPYGNVATTGTITLGGALTVLDSGNYTPTTDAEIILLQSSGTGKQLSGTFATSTLPSQFSTIGNVQYDYSENTVYIGISACTGDWQSASSGNWGDTADWVNMCAPGVDSTAADHDAATFPDVMGASTITVTLTAADGSSPQSVTLHDITFNATSATYTIQQNTSASQIILDKFPSPISKPRITMASAAGATIDAPIVINVDSRIYLSSGTLTLGASSTVTGATSTLYISEGATSGGTLINSGSMSPLAINMEGGTIQNNGPVLPTGTLTIAGLQGILSPLAVTNTSTMTAGTDLVIGGAGGATSLTNSGTMTATGAMSISATTVANSATMSSAGVFTITSGTITNSGTMTSSGPFSMSGGTLANSGHLSAVSGQTLTLSSGTLTNDSGAFLGLSTADITLSGGTLISSDEILANNYAQNSTSTLQINFPTTSDTPWGHVSADSSIQLAGSLIVTDTGGFSPPAIGEIVLLSSSGTGKQLAGTFSSVTLPINFSHGTVGYDNSENQVLLEFSSCNGIWQSTTSGNWADTTNWQGSCAPGIGGDYDVAQFMNVAAGNITATLATSAGSGPQSVTLHNLTFNASSTQFTIQQYNSSSQIILDALMSASKPRISALAGVATINAPIVINTDSRIYLGGGNLTLGANTIITSAASTTLYISEGSTTSTLTNNGSIIPVNVIIEGGTVNNNNNINPSSNLTISGIGGIASPVNVVNNSMMTAGATFTIGGTSGATNVVNAGVMNGVEGFLIESGTITNNSGATLGLSTATMTLSGGTLSTSGQVLANGYIQSAAGTLQINVQNATNTGTVAIAGVGSLNGTIVVNALSGFPASGPTTITLMTADGGFESAFSSTSFTNFPASVIPELISLPKEIQLNTTTVAHSHFSSAPQALFSAITVHNSLITRKCYQFRSRLEGLRQRETEVVALRLEAENQTIVTPTLEDAEPKVELNIVFEEEPRGFRVIFEDTAKHDMVVQGVEIQQKQAQLARRKSPDLWSVYAGPVASFGHIKTIGPQVGLGHFSVGGLFGFDYVVPKSEYAKVEAGIGSIVEFREEWGTAPQDAGSLTTERVHGSVYGTILPARMPELYFDWILGFAYAWDHLTRNTGSSMQRQAKGDPTEIVFDILTGVEYIISNKAVPCFGDNFSITPLLHLQYSNDHISSYKEHGAGVYDLSVDSQVVQTLGTSLGARFDYLFTARRYDVRVEIDAEWQHEFLNENRTVYFKPFHITNQSTGVTAIGAARNGVLVALDILATTRRGWQVEATSSFQWNNQLYDVFFYLGLGKRF